MTKIISLNSATISANASYYNWNFGISISIEKVYHFRSKQFFPYSIAFFSAEFKTAINLSRADCFGEMKVKSMKKSAIRNILTLKHFHSSIFQSFLSTLAYIFFIVLNYPASYCILCGKDFSDDSSCRRTNTQHHRQ